MMASSVLLLGLFLGGQSASHEGLWQRPDWTSSCAFEAPRSGSRDHIRREALEGSLEEDEEEDALPYGPSCSIAAFGPPGCQIDPLPCLKCPLTGSRTQPVRGPPRAV